MCKPCHRQAHGQKKRGRKSNKEIMALLQNQKQRENKRISSGSMTNEEIVPMISVFSDPEVKKLVENSATNLLLDRMILL